MVSPMSGAIAVEPARYAPGIDAGAYGEHRHITPTSAAAFDGRITLDGSSGYRAEPGRYHLYAGWFCPCSHRATIQIALNGLDDVVTVSYVDGLRDARGWAFREQTGPDPVNGFTLLREAYQATDADYAGPVTVPVLWDRQTSAIVSTDADVISRDLGVQFRPWATPDADLYPVSLRDQIDELGPVISTTVSRSLSYALYDAASAHSVRTALTEFDARLANRRYLLGDALTDADIQLWVELVRYDVGVNAQGRVGPPLTSYRDLWRYARELYALPAFGTTTEFRAFAAPLTVQLDW
jgi:putative glutathione S-transferase